MNYDIYVGMCIYIYDERKTKKIDKEDMTEIEHHHFAVSEDIMTLGCDHQRLITSEIPRSHVHPDTQCTT